MIYKLKPLLKVYGATFSCINRFSGLKKCVISFIPVRLTSLIKSERIDQLRKQYESFLEEDKKRKERNEYILGKLDNMRATTAVVPQAYHKRIFPDTSQISYRNNMAEVYRPIYDLLPDKQQQQRSDIAPYSSEPSFLKDLLKKFILIPKRQTKEEINVPINNEQTTTKTASHVDDSADWRSKYEILDKLKEIEKEDQQDVHIRPPLITIPDEKFLNNDNSLNNTNKPQTEYKYDLPEKDMTVSKPGYKVTISTPDQNLTNTSVVFKDREEIKPLKEDFITNDYTILADGRKNCYNTEPVYINDTLQDNNENVIKSDHKPYEESHRQLDTVANFDDHHNKLEESGYTHDNVNKDSVDIPQVAHYSDSNQNILTDDNVDSSNLQGSNINTHETLEQSAKEMYMDTSIQPEHIDNSPEEVNAEQYAADNNVNLVNTAEPKKGSLVSEQQPTVYDYGDSANTVPQYVEDPNVKSQDQISIEQNMHESKPLSSEEDQNLKDPDNPLVSSTDVKAFETEMNEMFYQDPVNDAAYDQNTFNQEYAQNDNYQQNEYQYCEGQQPQAFPSEINEHEETTERYDPNFEQQYAGNYEQQQTYEQQVYEQQNLGYEQQPGGYEQQPEVYEQQPEVYEQQPEVYAQSHPEVYEQQSEMYGQEGYEAQPQVEGYEQPPQPYDEQSYEQQVYEQQPSYDQLQQHENYESVSQIEQKLDNEQGYSVPENEYTEKPDAQEKQKLMEST